MNAAEQRAHDEAKVLSALIDHQSWMESLPVDSVMHRAFGTCLDVQRLCAAVRMPRRAVRRALARLLERGEVVRSADLYYAAATVDGVGAP